MFYVKLTLVILSLLWLSACGANTSPTPALTPTTSASAQATSAPTATTLPATPTPPAPTATAVPPSPTPAPPTPVPTKPPATSAPTAAPTRPPSTTFNPATTTIRLDKVADGLRAPTDIKHANDGSGRLFVVEKAGTVRIVRNGVVSPTPFLDITPLVGSVSSEQGLLGVAFHPKYKTNGFFYVNYTDTSGDTNVVRYKVSSNPDQADPNSAFPLLKVDQPAPNHNGGDLVFGPDGYLYVGLGDGGGAGDRYGNSQNPNALLAKMLRLDVDNGTPYGIPKDNPFVGRAGFRPEIWAWGLRNPWRYSFDRATGDLYIADVGQNAWEEVDFQPARSKGGENYGWNKLEASHCYPESASCDPSAFVAPIGEYAHGRGDCSVTGGYVYRGKDQPALTGAYFFADYCTGRFWALQRGADGRWTQTELITSGVTISSFGEDEQGELYVVSLSNGNLYRLVAAPK